MIFNKHDTRIEFFTHSDFFYANQKKLLCFEDLFDDQLKWDKFEREEFFDDGGHGIWMYVNGKLVAEALWNHETKTIAYSHATCVLKKYQGKGYGKMIRLFLYQHLKNLGYKTIKGHAKSGAAVAMVKSLGAKIISKSKRHKGTKYIYYHYKQRL